MSKNPDPPLDSPVSDSTATSAERRQQQLERLAQLGMELAEAEVQRLMVVVKTADLTDPAFKDLGQTFVRLVRDVHRTIAMAAALDAEENARKAQARRVAECEARAAAQPKLRFSSGALREEKQRREEERNRAAATAAAAAALANWEARKDRIRQGIENTIRAKAGTRAAATLLIALDARIDGLGAELARDTRPVAYIAAAICKDIGIDPDFSFWTNADLGFSDPGPGGKPQGRAGQPPPAAAPTASAAAPAASPAAPAASPDDAEPTKREAAAAAEDRRRRLASRLN